MLQQAATELAIHWSGIYSMAGIQVLGQALGLNPRRMPHATGLIANSSLVFFGAA
jgi:hypothetical protein